jgi:hypothetical protein
MRQTRARMAKLHPQTEPVTDAGKDISSRNALTHGGTSEKLIVPGERREDFDALLNNLLAEHSPETPDARNLVDPIAKTIAKRGPTVEQIVPAASDHFVS